MHLAEGFGQAKLTPTLEASLELRRAARGTAVDAEGGWPRLA